MTTKPDPREPMDPEVKALFDLLRATAPAARALEPEAVRAGAAALVPFLNAGAPEDVKQEEIRIPVPGGGIRALVFRPPSPAPERPTLVYLHGGGWVILSPDSHAKLAKRLARGSGAVVVSVDYRLAPEHPYPAPLEDCVTAFRFVREHAARFGGDPSRVALAGDSAGGNMTAAVTLRLLASGDAPPRAIALVCPVTEMSLDTASYRRFAPDDPILDDGLMKFFRDCYARPEQWGDPFVSPLRASVEGFPPSCVVVGTIDPLLDDGIAFAARLRAAGVPTRLESYEGMPHVFLLFPGIGAGDRCIADLSAFFRDAWR